MAAPTDTDLEYYFGADGNPNNDADPVGGAVVTSNVDQTVVNNLIYKPTISATLKTYRGVAYRGNVSAGTLTNAKFAIVTGGKRSVAGGVFRVTSSSGSDTGKVWVCFKKSGDWYTEEITLAGTSWSNASQLVDANSDWVAVNEAGEPVGNLTIQINGANVGYIRGATDYPGKANKMACTLFELAVASAINGTVACANRLTDPTGTGAFSSGYQVPGDDQAMALPANLGASQTCGYCVRLTVPANLPMPYGRQIVADVDLQGDPIA